MHELAIAEAICTQVQSYMEKDQRLVKVVVECGPMSGVVPDALHFSFGIASKHAGLGEVALDLITPKAPATCPICELQFEIEEMWAHCPECNHSPVTVEGGRELRIKHIEVE